MTDLAVLQSQFTDHIKDSDEKNKVLLDSIKIIEAELKNRITFATFSWTLGIIMTVVLATLAFIANQVSDMRKDLQEQQVVQYSTQSNVSYIKGLLDKAEVTK